MKPIAIDFGRQARRSGRGVYALAVLLASAAAMMSLQGYLALRAERDAWELVQAELPSDAPEVEKRSPADEAASARLAELAKVRDRQATPWERLFNTLEGVPTDGVALLELTGDSETRQLSVAAQAREMAAMHAYLTRLGETAGFDAVYLASHQSDPGAAPRTVRFSVMADWRALEKR